MRSTIIFALVSLIMAAPAAAQDPRLKLERDDFFREMLSAQPSVRTRLYDSGVKGGYQILKTDVVRGLPDAAKARNVDLRALLIIGPYGANNILFVYTFIGETSLIRVNQITMAQGRFTYKSTGVITQTEFQGFCSGLLKANVLNSGLPPADGELTYETLLARWSDGELDPYYGSSINPKSGANMNEFRKLTGQLLNSLTKTYPLLQPPPVSKP